MSDWELLKRIDRLEKAVYSLAARLGVDEAEINQLKPKPPKKKYPKTRSIQVHQR